MPKRLYFIALATLAFAWAAAPAVAEQHSVVFKNETQYCFTAKAYYHSYDSANPTDRVLIGQAQIEAGKRHTFRYKYEGTGAFAVSAQAVPCTHGQGTTPHGAYVNDAHALVNFSIVHAGDHYEIDFRGP